MLLLVEVCPEGVLGDVPFLFFVIYWVDAYLVSLTTSQLLSSDATSHILHSCTGDGRAGNRPRLPLARGGLAPRPRVARRRGSRFFTEYMIAQR